MRIVAGTAGGRRFEAPEGINTRGTLDRVRENLFNILQMRIRSARVLDLFAGSGALSLEALRRGAERAVMVDSNREANRIQRKNAETLGMADRTEIYLCDWSKAVSRLLQEHRMFNLVFLDPPYRMTDMREVFTAIYDLVEPDGLVILEHEAKAEILTGDQFEETDRRKWGYCGVSFYRKTQGATEERIRTGQED